MTAVEVLRGGGIIVIITGEVIIIVNRSKKLKKVEEMARMQQDTSKLNFSPTITNSSVEDESQTTPTSFSNTPVEYSMQQCVVPCSKWICIKPFMDLSDTKADIFIANLIYHPIMCCDFASPQCGSDIPKEEDKSVTKE